jgi:GNAT superfamily N-acetyltransferase
MTRDDIIRMAGEAELSNGFRNLGYPYLPELERFANLVAAAERERIKWDTIHSCHPHCDRPACVAVRRAREDEREMCAKVVEEWLHGEWHNQGVIAALMIRERGAP